MCKDLSFSWGGGGGGAEDISFSNAMSFKTVSGNVRQLRTTATRVKLLASAVSGQHTLTTASICPYQTQPTQLKLGRRLVERGGTCLDFVFVGFTYIYSVPL